MTSEYKYSFKRSIGRRNATIHSIWFPVNFHFANCFFWRIFYEWERIMISVPNRDLPVLLSTRQFQFFLRDSRGMKNCFLIEIIIQVCPPSFFFFIYPTLPSEVTIRHIANFRIATLFLASFHHLEMILCIRYEVYAHLIIQLA